MNADQSFERIATFAETNCQPPERGAAIAATLREMAPIVAHLPLSMCAAAETMFFLGRMGPNAKPDDAPNIAARRKTCEELEGALATSDPVDGIHSDRRAAAVLIWTAICEHLKPRLGGDPRRLALLQTYERELAELRNAADHHGDVVGQKVATSPEIAKRLYQVYAQHADWKDYRGEPLPTFDEMREATRGHWLHVAEDLCIYGMSADKNAARIAETARR